MSLNTDDLKRVQTLTWKELDFFLFHMATKPDGSPLDRFDLLDKHGAVSRTSERVQRLFIGAIEAGYLIPSRRSDKTSPEDWPIRKKEVVAWIIENEIISLLEKADIAIQESKLKIFKKLFAKSKEEDFFNRTQISGWCEVGFNIKQDASLEVKIKKTRKTFSGDDLKRKFSREKNWLLLMQIIHHRGQVSKTVLDKETQKHLKKYISFLRNDLKALFNIDESPIKYIKGEYTAGFACHSNLAPPKETDSWSWLQKTD
jgi:hypothetical protein